MDFSLNAFSYNSIVISYQYHMNYVTLLWLLYIANYFSSSPHRCWYPYDVLPFNERLRLWSCTNNIPKYFFWMFLVRRDKPNNICLFLQDLTSFTITIYPRDGSVIDSSTPVRIASHTETFLRPRPTSPIQRTYSKNNITFVFIYRLNVTCAKHYYGENCVYCLGRNDRFGHSRCLQNGTKVCIYGWKGKSCTERK